MNENTNLETTAVEDEAILPDGWTEDADYFNSSTWGSEGTAAKEDDFFADVLDGAQEEETPAEVKQTDEEPTTAPEFGTAPSTNAEPSAEGFGTPTTETAAPAAEQPSTKLRFKARVDHEDTDVEMDESDLPTIWQKATATDRYQAKLAKVNPMLERLERMAKNNGYDTVEAMLDAQETYDRETAIEKLVKEGTPKVIAEDYYDRTYGRPAPAQTAPENTGKAAEAIGVKTDVQTNNPPARDYAAEVRELWAMRPDLKGTKIPSEVAAAAANGQNIALAYFAYEAKQAKATAEQLRQENNTYKQNAATAAKAPVKGVSGGGATNTQPEDMLLKGFDSGW